MGSASFPSMPSSRDVDVLFVGGGWHTSKHYEPAISALVAKGINAYAYTLPTCEVAPYSLSDTAGIDKATPPKGGWPDHFTDAARLVGKLRFLIENKGHYVLIVAHSYGGVPASEAVNDWLTAKARKRQGAPGGVIGIFFIAGSVVPVKSNVVEWVSSRLKLGAVVHESGLITPPGCPSEIFYNDLSGFEQMHWSTLLVPQALTAFTSRVENAGWMKVPCAYLITQQDNIMLPSTQEVMISEAQAAGADFVTYRAATSHAPFLSWIEGLAENVMDFGVKSMSKLK